MPKKKNLNGLPYNLIQQYFSTLFYCAGGYMVDWIFNAADEKNISKVQIDIINQTVSPKELAIPAITDQLIFIQTTIKNVLTSNNFLDNFIVKTKFEIHISPENKGQRTISCIGICEDKDGKIYVSEPYTEKSYETFPVFTH